MDEVYYSYTATAAPSDLAGPHVFVYTDNNGVKYTNVVTIPQDLAVDTPIGEIIDTSKSFTVNWTSSDALASTDEVNIIIANSGNTSSVMGDDFGTQDTSGSVTFDESQMMQLAAGNYQMQVCRKQFLPLQSGTSAGGDILVARCLAGIPLVLTPR